MHYRDSLHAVLKSARVHLVSKMKVGLAGALLSVCASVFAQPARSGDSGKEQPEDKIRVSCTDSKKLAEMVAADLLHPVRPGGVDGRPFWNRRSIHFMYAPAFDFKAIPGARAYRFTVIDDSLNEHVFTAEKPTADLSPVWGALPTGFARVTVEALDQYGRGLGRCGFRRFWKLAPYEPGTYPGKPYSYKECVNRYYSMLLSHTNTQHFLKHGRPDGYTDLLNIYPSKMNSALIEGMLSYAKTSPENREAAMAVARKAADYTLSISQGADAPLAHFPPTYWKMANQKSDFASQRYAGQNMLVYPAVMGNAYLTLHAATGDRKYLDAAVGIARTYERLQLPDGTWYLKYWERDASPVVDAEMKDPAKLTPVGVCDFMESLVDATGDKSWHEISDRAFAYIDAGPLKTYDFGPQFEDTRPSVNYHDLTSVVPMQIAIYLLRRFPKNPERIEQAKELMRWTEDQFICWRKPCRANGHGMLSEPWHGFNPRWSSVVDKTEGRDFANWVDVPGVLEKYRWSIMENTLAALASRTYMALYRVSCDELAFAKARTLADSIVRVQAMGPHGETVTHWDLRCVARGISCTHNWVNCGVHTAAYLAELSHLME